MQQMNTQPITAILVDDEEKARNLLLMLLTEHCPQVQVLAQCKNVPEAVIAINKHKPALVFLDVDMPEYSGFQLLDFISTVDFEIIFTTAFSEYAVQAFRVSALDYLMKPINIKQLVAAVNKAQEKKQPDVYSRQLNLIQDSYTNKKLDVIAISTISSIEFVRVTDIIFLQAENAYTRIVLNGAKDILASKNIKEFEDMLLPDSNFIRVHRSYLLNIAYVLRYNKVEGGSVEMKGGQQLPVSKKLKDDLIGKMTG